MRRWPFSIQIALSHTRSTCSMLWDTNKTVVLCSSMSSLMRFSHFSWKNMSPTESASSTMRISGTMTVATENATRAIMPDE